MTRIHITGNAGSGKTTFAHELSSSLGLPVAGLDRIVWQTGWKKTPALQRAAAEDALISQKEWIIEGVSKRVRQSADIIIFLDVKPPVSLWRCAKRNWKYLFSGRPELPENCPEILIVPMIFKIIFNFYANVRPMILDDLKKHGGDGYIVRNQSELDALKIELAGRGLPSLNGLGAVN